MENLKARLQRDMQHMRTSTGSADERAEQRSTSRQRQHPDSGRARAEPDTQERQQRSSLDDDTARDMADIDSRLLALQKFLMAAKSSS